MNNPGGMGGPGGQQQMMNAGTPGASSPSGPKDNKKQLNTYIYDYFLRNEMHDVARLLFNQYELELHEKPSPNRKDVNGVLDGDSDSKNDIVGKPADLPKPNVPGEVNSAFLLDWWSMFWDVWSSGRSAKQSSTRNYLQHVQNRVNTDRQRMMGGQVQNNMGRGMMPNGVPEGMKRAMMMQGNRPQNPQHLQQQMQRMMAQQQGAMQRDGSAMEINGQQRPQTPGSGDAPSPKRQRLESGAFNGQMPPMGRGQPAMPAQAMAQMQMQGQNVKSMQVYQQNMRQHTQNALDSDGQKGMPNPNGIPQGLQQGGGPNNSNHALQDYQMQLMLLEQQNKKRLLMARQEQDGATGPNGTMAGPPGPGGPGSGGTAMSPSNSRAGPSPNPDKMERGTPKMAPSGIPQGALDGMQGRGSPAPGTFDPSQMNPNMPPGFQGMKMSGMIGPNGQMMPATSHPAFNGQMNGQMTQQQMEMMRHAQQGRPNGPWQGPPPGMMPGPQPGPNMQTPLQRQMPPPPAPATGDAPNKTQPSSPSQSNAAPPTPSQTNKPNPKKKEGAKNKKNQGKKGNATDATPASEAGDQPPTPTPAPPITPTAPGHPFAKNQQGQQNQPGQQMGMPNHGQPDLSGGPFGGSLEGNDLGFGMDFGALESDAVLDGFDFDNFLVNNDDPAAFSFEPNLSFGPDGGLEAGGDV